MKTTLREGMRNMNLLTIKGGNLLSPANGLHGEKGDVLVKDGKIVEVGGTIEPQGDVIDATGCYVTPGFIDIHTHCYPKVPLGIDPDELGIKRGTTTILDAGSSGADTYEDFRATYVDHAETKVFTLLNISKEGLIRGHELDDPSKVDVDACMACANAHRDNIVGLKARASASVVGDQGLTPIATAAQTAHELGLPLTVHVGNYPPALGDVIDLLDRGDIVTHVFHGKPGGLVTPEGLIIDQALRGRTRGVRFDVGHGVESFSFNVFRRALAAGFDCDSISTDLHSQNYEGPVFDLATTMSKLIACGEKFEDAISKVTSVAARTFGLDGLGQLAPSMTADINLITFDPSDEQAQDATGTVLPLGRRLLVRKTIYSRGTETTVVKHPDTPWKLEVLSPEELKARAAAAKKK